LVVIATLVLGWGQAELTPVQAELLPTSLGSGGLLTHVQEADSDRVTRVIVVDPVQRRMAVYHVEFDSGAIQLKSVRNLTTDLQIQEFNSGEPSPVDMEKMLQRR
jgi:hypothetical protein